MTDFPPVDAPTTIQGLREVCEFGDRKFSRRKGTKDWIEDKSDPGSKVPPAEFPHLYLYLVQEAQGRGKPNHWAIFLADENEPDYGYVYQVTGEEECMTYEPSAEKVNVFDAGIASNIFTLAVVSEGQARAAALVRESAEQEPPPRAEFRSPVTESCQEWTLRVIARLVNNGIVMRHKLEKARLMMQPA